MPSYERFVALMQRVIMILAVLLHTLLSKSSNISYIDSTKYSLYTFATIKESLGTKYSKV